MNPKQSKHIENHAQTHENKTEENQIQRKKNPESSQRKQHITFRKDRNNCDFSSEIMGSRKQWKQYLLSAGNKKQPTRPKKKPINPEFHIQ